MVCGGEEVLVFGKSFLSTLKASPTPITSSPVTSEKSFLATVFAGHVVTAALVTAILFSKWLYQ